MNTEVEHELELQSLLNQEHHDLIQQYRKALHLHGDPSQSENESDADMRKSISEADAALVSGDLH